MDNSSNVGKLTVAGIVTLLAFPLIYAGISKAELEALCYVGLVMIMAGMAAAPILTFFFSERNEH